MLTFGMRRYLITVFNKIVIYPESYLSQITGEYHKGEFNPGMKIIFFIGLILKKKISLRK
jgi:hypothetical protein